MSTVVTLPGIDLGAICQSGQCFRMAQADNGYEMITGSDRVLVTMLSGDKYEFSCDKEQLARVWLPYLDEDTDYGAILSSIDPCDAALSAASVYGRGLRILRQDPWEALISFIISQRRSIPSIRTCVSRLCRAFGDRREDERGEYYLFPTAEALARADESDILACGLGYRAKYVLSAARRFACGEMSARLLSAMDDDELKRVLLSVYGVGEKVAFCTMLFGFHRLDAFPVDTWVSRVEKRYYAGRFPRERYKGVAGVMQQYLFAAVVNGAIEC